MAGDLVQRVHAAVNGGQRQGEEVAAEGERTWLTGLQEAMAEVAVEVEKIAAALKRRP